MSSLVQNQLRGDVTEIIGSSIGFEALKTAGQVVVWGGKCTVAAQLQEVQAIAGCGSAFAAVQDGGRVVTWGERFGSDSSTVQDQLRGHYHRPGSN